MNNLLAERMKTLGGSVSKGIRTRSDDITNKTFMNDLGYKKANLYDRYGRLLEADIDVKYQFSQVYTIAKDQVDYLIQFRPGYFPEKIYKDADGIERLGFYLEIPDDNSGDIEKWIIVGRNDKNSNIRYNILKCNWTFGWVCDGIVYHVLGILRSRNNYNSGVLFVPSYFAKSR